MARRVLRPAPMWKRWLLVTAAVALGCGTTPDAEPFAAKAQPILGGVKDDGHTAVVAIFREPAGASSAIFCSGALIGPNLVLTAGHCVADIVSGGSGTACEDTDTRKADRVGEAAVASRFSVVNTTDAYDSGAKAYGVVRVIPAPDASNVPNCGNDVALLVLAEPIAGATAYAPRLDGPPAAADTFTAIGYGYDGAVNTDGTRRSRDGLAIASVGELREAGKLRATANDWIAAEGPCGGDSGSPAIDAQGRIVGVMSRGTPTVCKSMVYTRVDPFSAWMKSAALEAAQSGGYSAPAWARPSADAAADGAAAPAPDSSSSCSVGPSPAGSTDAALVVVAALALVVRSRRLGNPRERIRKA